MLKQKVFILIGPPGSGKGTQAEFLQEKLKANHYSMGDILRKEIAKKTALGKKVSHMVKTGLLVPDEIPTEMIINRLKQTDKPVILDGYPRSVKQAEDLDVFLKEKGTENIVIEVAIPDKEVFERIGGRRTCACGEIFHTKFNPPKKDGICDECGGKLEIRADAKPEVIKDRVKIYHEQTQPVLDFYQKKDNYRFIKINGMPPIDEVHETIMKKMAKS